MEHSESFSPCKQINFLQLLTKPILSTVKTASSNQQVEREAVRVKDKRANKAPAVFPKGKDAQKKIKLLLNSCKQAQIKFSRINIKSERRALQMRK